LVEPIFMKFGMYIKVPEPISNVYFINPFHESVYPYIVAMQRLGKNVTAAMNTQGATVEWDLFYAVRVVSKESMRLAPRTLYFLMSPLKFMSKNLFQRR
jgi:hypothetical protein